MTTNNLHFHQTIVARSREYPLIQDLAWPCVNYSLPRPHAPNLSLVVDKAIPYSGFISREKIFANFVDLSQFVKILFTNIALILDPDPMPRLI